MFGLFSEWEEEKLLESSSNHVDQVGEGVTGGGVGC